ALMRILADFGVFRKERADLRAIHSRGVNGRIVHAGRHQTQETAAQWGLHDGPQGLVNALVRQCDEAFSHEFDTVLHGKGIKDVIGCRNQDFHTHAAAPAAALRCLMYVAGSVLVPHSSRPTRLPFRVSRKGCRSAAVATAQAGSTASFSSENRTSMASRIWSSDTVTRPSMFSRQISKL